MAPGEVTTRQEGMDLLVPWQEDDEGLSELLGVIAVEGKRVREIEVQIDKLKTRLKPFKEALNAAQEEIINGRRALVPCEIEIRWDENIVYVRRLDTKEIVSSREINEDDRQMHFEDQNNVTTGFKKELPDLDKQSLADTDKPYHGE